MGDALAADPRAGFAYTEAWELDESSGRFLKATAMARQHPPSQTLPQERFVAELMQRNFVYNAVTVRRSVLEQVGGYDQDMTPRRGLRAVAADRHIGLRRGTGAGAAGGQARLAALAVQRRRGDGRRCASGLPRGARAPPGLTARQGAGNGPSGGASREPKAVARGWAGDCCWLSEAPLPAPRALRACATNAASEPPPGVADAFPQLGRGDVGAPGRAR